MSRPPSFGQRRRNNASRTLTCRQCRVIVAKAEHAERMAAWHTPGDPSFDCDGQVQEFDSKLEAQVWHELCAAFDSGRLVSLRRQVRYPIHVAGGARVGYYVADFVVEQRAVRDGREQMVTRIIDAKGERKNRSGKKVSIDTPLAKFKRACVEAEYGIRVELWASPRGEL